MKSFSARAKEELAQMDPGKPCCMVSELCGMLYTAGTLSLLGGRGLRLRIESKHMATAERAAQLMTARFQAQPNWTAIQRRRLGGQPGYRVELQGEQARAVLRTSGLVQNESLDSLRAADDLCRDLPACCRLAFLRGAFLGGGSMANPEKEYHLEFIAGDETLGNAVMDALGKRGLLARRVERKGMIVLYIKEAEQIVELLTLLGAHGARCELEGVRIYKELRNQVNRATNCDSANISKTLDAAARQLEAIGRVEKILGLRRLPEPLQEVARKRRNHPEMSLEELGKTLNPPIGKSGVNHRLKRIEEIAASLEDAQAQGVATGASPVEEGGYT